MKRILFYRDKPLFGLDISPNGLCLAEISAVAGKPSVLGYGYFPVDPKAFKDGAILDPRQLALDIKPLIDTKIVGQINSKRVAIAIPAARTYSRAISLPLLEDKELGDAVRLEVEQYVPIALDELYLDYAVVHRSTKDLELFAVAAPKLVVDSYLTFARQLGFQPIAVESSVHSASRLLARTDDLSVPTVLIDFGATTADITIIDRTVVATATVGSGANNFTARIAQYLGVTTEEAHDIKSKVGLSFSNRQSAIKAAVSPELDQLFKEIQRMTRYFQDRYGNKRKISQIVLLGAAGMPGLSEHLTDTLRLPVRTADPWQKFNFGKFPSKGADRSPYVAAFGLGLIDSKGLFA